MLSHVTIGANDIDKARAFYDAVLAPLGISRRYTFPDSLGYGPPGEKHFPNGASTAQLWVMRPFDGGTATQGNGWHCAFLAPNRAAVDVFHAAALASGGTCEGPPGLRPHYHPTYYAAYVRDPEGNKLQAVHHGRSGGADV
jgi:catechol 2,3-dioxygenase-like lactoylglutathione lyase family enzyme